MANQKANSSPMSKNLMFITHELTDSADFSAVLRLRAPCKVEEDVENSHVPE